MRTLTLISTLLAVIFISPSPVIADSGSGSQIKVACNVPLSGPLAVYGSAIQEGAALAQRDLAPAEKSRVVYDWEDNRSMASHAVSAARKQLADQPNIYISGVKPQYMAIGDIVAAKKIPHFVWIFDTHIRKKHSLNYRTWVNFKVEPPLFIDYAKRLAPQRIAIVYAQLPHTDEEYNQFVIPGMRAAGFSEFLVEPYQFDKLDFKDTSLRLKRFAPQLIILCGFQENLVALIRALHNLKLIVEGNTVVSYDLLDAASILKPNEIEGIRVSAPSFLLNTDRPDVSKWYQRFEEVYKKKPVYTHAYAYDMASIILDAVSRTGPAVSNEVLHKALAQTEISGVTGKLKFDDQGDLLPQVELGVFRNGKLVRDLN